MPITNKDIAEAIGKRIAQEVEEMLDEKSVAFRVVLQEDTGDEANRYGLACFDLKVYDCNQEQEIRHERGVFSRTIEWRVG